MQFTKYDGKPAVQVLAAMITDQAVLARIAARYERGMFGSEDADLVADLCVGHYRNHGAAPNGSMPNMFAAWATDRPRSEDVVKRVESLLTHISQQHEQDDGEVNSSYVVDQAEKLFRKVRILKRNSEIDGHVRNGDLDKAEAVFENWTKLQLGSTAVTSPMTDLALLDKTFDDPPAPLVTYPGPMGHFLNSELVADSFIAVTAPEKTGKTFFLLDLAYRAMCQRKRVFFFEVGDMSEQQILLRWYVRNSGHPAARGIRQWPHFVDYPESIKIGSDGNAVVTHQQRKFDGPLTKGIARKAMERTQQHIVRSKNDYIHFMCYPNSTCSVANIAADIRNREREEGFVPDVVVIDYADILAGPAGSHKMDLRDQINTNWKQLRRLSQERHCLVVTATQANAASYKHKGLLNRSHFSEDKRKLSHINGMLGLNVNAVEKASGTMRINWIALREGVWGHRECFHVATCLPLANPAVLSVKGEYRNGQED